MKPPSIGGPAVALLVLLTVLLAACSRPIHHQESYVFGTRVEILVADADEKQARSAVAAVLSEFDRLHRTYHAWQPSELTELNAALSNGKARHVSHEMAFLLSDAQRFSALGEGLFDPGIGWLIQRWGFQSDDFKAVLPSPAVLADWRQHRAGIADLQLDGETVSNPSRIVSIDLGGYLKGYALDRAAAILGELGIKNALINIGGNILALGDKHSEPWRVGIQHPRRPEPLATLELRSGEAIGTSGDYQRYFELDGKRYSHLLDPRSGEPVDHTQALTVLISPRANSGTLSDVASKPLFIAGAGWPELAMRLDVDQVLRVDAEGKVSASPKMYRRLTFVDGAPDASQIPLPDAKLSGKASG